MDCTQTIRARRSIRRFKPDQSVPAALIAVGVPDEDPPAWGFCQTGKVTWLG